MFRRLMPFLVISLAALAANGATLELPVNIRFTIDAGEHYSLPVALKKGEYIRGHLSGQSALEAMIHDDSGPVRYLAGHGDSEAWIYFAAPEAGNYRLVIQTLRPEAEVHLKLEKVPLLAPGENIRSDIQSRRVLSARQALQNGQTPDSVWSSLVADGTPLVELPDDVPDSGLKADERLVTFLWYGANDRVLLFGGPGYEHDPLFRLAGTDIWYRSYAMPADTRMSYMLAPDVPRVNGSPRDQRVAILATAQRDPANPHVWYPGGASDVYNSRSVLELDKAPSDNLLDGDRPLPEPSRYPLTSDRLGNTRDIAIMVPEDLNASGDDAVPLVIFFDGDDYLSKVPAPRILDNLSRSGEIPPVVAVFVSNPNRSARNSELPCNETFADFMALELLPFVAGKTGLVFSGEQTLLAGASFGGLASACTAYRYPELFGLVLSQSGSFWWSPEEDVRPEWLNARLAEAPLLPVRFYLSAGVFETDFGESGILNANRQLEQILSVKGYDVMLEEFGAGHDYYHWRATLGRGLVHLLGEFADQ
ncbi:hypothetical protein CPA50_16340 [Marinobacter sp. ANT_B65]|nr:hypothetical protein CPA50_16340 [Marinobacter sp. ANT_B65]